jgi:hypothetical protein
MQPVSRQLIGKDVPAATNTNTTIHFLLETVFSTLSVQSGYKEDNWGDLVQTRVEEGSNISTVTLRVVGGEKEESLKSETVKYDREYQGTEPEKDCTGKGQQHIQKADPPSHQRGRPTNNKTVTVKQ